MKYHPIIYDGESIRGILAGIKTQTRRVIPPAVLKRWGGFRPQYADEGWDGFQGDWDGLAHKPDDKLTLDAQHVKAALWKLCPYGTVGDRLWVRETWKIAWTIKHGHGIRYRADDALGCWNGCCNDLHLREGYDWLVEHYGRDHRTEPWRSPIHMPRWASRITQEIVEIGPQRLQEMSVPDCIAEGIDHDATEEELAMIAVTGDGDDRHKERFADRWDALNAKRHFPWDSNPWVWRIVTTLIGKETNNG